MKRLVCIALCLSAAALSQAQQVRQSASKNARNRAPNKAGSKQQLAAIAKAADALRPLHAKLGKPRPGEWLLAHREAGQTFQQYLTVRPPALGVSRNTIYLVPLGKHNSTQGTIEADTAEFLTLFYGMPTRWLDPIDDDTIPTMARRTNPQTGQPQFNSIYILNEVLRSRVPDDAAALLALTATDLWPGDGWNFVFGQGSLGQPTGVWSMHRFGNADDEQEKPRVLLRMLKTATHETGHLFGMPHCTAYECGMNGSNSLTETDRHPLAFCSECDAKVWLVSRADRRQRYLKLAAFANKHDLPEAEKLWTASAEAVSQVGP